MQWINAQETSQFRQMLSRAQTSSPFQVGLHPLQKINCPVTFFRIAFPNILFDRATLSSQSGYICFVHKKQSCASFHRSKTAPDQMKLANTRYRSVCGLQVPEIFSKTRHRLYCENSDEIYFDPLKRLKG